MIKSLLAVAIVATATLLSAAPAFAQARYPEANAPVYVPPSADHLQAQATGQTGICGPDALKALDSPGLRIQQYNGTENRMSVISALQTAANYAKAGNEQECWHWYDRAQAVVR